jgi:hypothetical protein
VRRRLVAAGLGGIAAAALAWPASAVAHGLVGRTDLPIPEWLFGWAAAVVLIVSFVGLAVLWPEPKLQQPRERALVRIPLVVDVACGLIGVFVFAVVVYAGLAGTKTPTANLAPTWIYVVFWVGAPVLSAFLGDVFRAFNPWLALARLVACVAGRVGGGGAGAEPLAYPERLGRWPAVVTILCFGWIELVYTGRDDPRLLAVLAVGYAVIQLIGMSVYGIERWTDRGDGFSVYFGLFARIAPLRRREDRMLVGRAPLAGLPAMAIVPGTLALILVALGTTVFDGASEGPLWGNIGPDLQRFFQDLGLSPKAALQVAWSIGLAGAIALVSLVYRVGVRGMTTVERGHPVSELARRFAHTLVPIMFAYVLAHYFSLLVYQGQAVAFLASDPLGDGSDIFGTADKAIDYGVISATGIWYVQVGALVVGHVAALVLAHDRALAMFRTPRAATRSQAWMLAVMVLFTSLGLWLLSAANQ